MVILHGLIGIALTAAQVAAPPESSPASPPVSAPASTTVVVPLNGFDLGKKPGSEVSKTQAETILSQCSDRRFETSAEGMIDGEMKRRRITLCAAPGDSDGQWIVKLENAVAWVKAQAGLSDPVKGKLVADLQAKISEVKSIRPLRALPSSGLRAEDALVATVPPMPPPLPGPSNSLSIALPLVTRPPPAPALRRVGAIQTQVSKPRISISCPPPAEPSIAAPCFDLAADTALVVRAEENVKTKLSLRFIRDGDLRGSIALGMMRRGQIVRIRLPARVCAGVVRGRVEIQTIVTDPASGAQQVADTQGPFRLHC